MAKSKVLGHNDSMTLNEAVQKIVQSLPELGNKEHEIKEILFDQFLDPCQKISGNFTFKQFMDKLEEF